MVSGLADEETKDEWDMTKELQSQLARKDLLIVELKDTIWSLKLDSTSKDSVISNLRNQLQQVQHVSLI